MMNRPVRLAGVGVVCGLAVVGNLCGSGNFLKGVKTARIVLETFGNDGGRYGPKDVWCNGLVVGQLPEKQLPDAWEPVDIQISVEHLWVLQRVNVLRVIQPAVDSFKIRNVALRIQAADGQWQTSSVATNVLCSSGEDWPFKDGTSFVDGRYSPEITVVVE